jgi:hypothetical protein
MRISAKGAHYSAASRPRKQAPVQVSGQSHFKTGLGALPIRLIPAGFLYLASQGPFFTVLLQDIQRDVAEDGEIVRAASQPAFVLIVVHDDIEPPMQPVFDDTFLQNTPPKPRFARNFARNRVDSISTKTHSLFNPRPRFQMRFPCHLELQASPGQRISPKISIGHGSHDELVARTLCHRRDLCHGQQLSVGPRDGKPLTT